MDGRNIKNGLYGWYEKEAMKKIESLPFKKQASCKLIYIAICSVSAKNKNNSKVDDDEKFKYMCGILKNMKIKEENPEQYQIESNARKQMYKFYDYWNVHHKNNYISYDLKEELLALFKSKWELEDITEYIEATFSEKRKNYSDYLLNLLKTSNTFYKQ